MMRNQGWTNAFGKFTALFRTPPLSFPGKDGQREMGSVEEPTLNTTVPVLGQPRDILTRQAWLSLVAQHHQSVLLIL